MTQILTIKKFLIITSTQVVLTQKKKKNIYIYIYIYIFFLNFFYIFIIFMIGQLHIIFLEFSITIKCKELLLMSLYKNIHLSYHLFN